MLGKTIASSVSYVQNITALEWKTHIGIVRGKIPLRFVCRVSVGDGIVNYVLEATFLMVRRDQLRTLLHCLI